MEKVRILLFALLAVLAIMWLVRTSKNYICENDKKEDYDMHPELKAKLALRAQESGVLVSENGSVETTPVMKGGKALELTGVFVLEDGRKGQFINTGEKAQLENGVIVEVVDGEVPLDSIIDEDSTIKRIVAFESESDASETKTQPKVSSASRIDGVHNTQTNLLIPNNSDVSDESHVRDMYEFYKKCDVHNEENRIWKFKNSLASTVCADDSLPHCSLKN